MFHFFIKQIMSQKGSFCDGDTNADVDVVKSIFQNGHCKVSHVLQSEM